MSEDSEKRLWLSAMMLNRAVRSNDLALFSELRTTTHREKVKELEHDLRSSCERVADKLTRLQLYQVGITFVLHWEGTKEPYAWLALDTSTAGQVVLQLASALPGHERRTVVKLEPYVSNTGVREGWEIAPGDIVMANQFADYCIGTLLDYCADILSEDASARGGSNQPSGG